MFLYSFSPTQGLSATTSTVSLHSSRTMITLDAAFFLSFPSTPASSSPPLSRDDTSRQAGGHPLAHDRVQRFHL